MTNILTTTHLCKNFTQGHTTIEVIKNCDLQVQKGQRIAIIGRSGSGKTTLLNLLSGMESPTSGHIEFNNAPLIGPSPSMSVIFQKHHLLKEFTAVENVMMPLLLRNISRIQAKVRAMKLLSEVGLANRLEHKPQELSGGECGRVAIARALISNPVCLLADEPTGNLDANTKDEVMDVLLERVHHANISMILVTHDMSLLHNFEQIYTLEQGRLKSYTSFL